VAAPKSPAAGRKPEYAGRSRNISRNFLKKGIDFMEKVRYNVFLHKGLF
jgi:hypothetical protein